eukprot:CAMPEP_0168516180 /NCGR_PEP_ID=MMETSP0405-20121227/5251_1 /TAXON_ID=498012 /ORGANISM="Trichosphaerium sp, Strain Am-I-7 wt" /LENGTH=806 /DNA_ID=CAMNT_0008535847 /DNA_START=658 /DNA_END=3075 /DNA_ORIENTATION=-
MREVPIYHIATSAVNPHHWIYSAESVKPYWVKNVPKKSIAKCDVTFVPNYANYSAQFFVKYQLPSYLYLASAKLMRSKLHQKEASRLAKIIERCSTLMKTFWHFFNNEWFYSVRRGYEVFNGLSKADQIDFNYDYNTIDWHQYLYHFAWGLHRFILKEDIDCPTQREIENARPKLRDIAGTNRLIPTWFPDTTFALTSSRKVKFPASSKYRTLRRSVLHSERVLDSIQRVSEETGESTETLNKRATQIMDRMASRLHMPVVRFMAYFFRKVWRNLYSQVTVNEEQLMKLRGLAEKGPLVIVPSHRSYIDFLIISYIFFTYDITIPHIAAGEDFLNMPGVSPLLRRCGAFFLKRSFKGDVLYNAIFTEYVQKLLMLNCPLEFFIEGTRSRSGKMLQPKVGLLSMITETYFDGQVDDINIVPVNINYDKIIEAEIYPNELLGEPKTKESLEGLVRGSYIFRESWGKIMLKVGEPISLNDYVGGFVGSNKSLDPFKNKRDRKPVNMALSHQIVYDINAHTVWPGSTLVSAILLTYRLGISKQSLIEKVGWLQNEILTKGEGLDDWIVGEKPEKLVSQCLMHLGNCVDVRKEMVVANDTGIIPLAFYRNKLVHLFAQDGFVACAMARHGSNELLKTKGIERDAVIQDAHFLSDLLAVEFVYRPNPQDAEDFNIVIDKLLSSNVLSQDQNSMLISEGADTTFYFYCGLLWPFIESYWICCVVLLSLKPHNLNKKNLMSRMQWLAETLHREGKITFHESCSIETLRNAIGRFGTWGIVTTTKEHISLSPDWKNVETKLTALYERLSSFRKSS